MKIIKCNEAEKGQNSEKCKTFEYSFGDKDIDLGVAVITGRFPDEGYASNLICKELIYVLEGSGTIHFDGKTIEFSAGDSILINNNDKYYYETDYCKISMTCTPAWSKDQHRIIL